MNGLVRVLGSRPVVAASSRVTRGRLRVLAYHRIEYPDRFARQLDRLSSRYTAVTGSAVADWIEGRGDLPDQPVWITFDDAYPSVVRDGMALLAERNMVATMFVCPGLVDTCRPHWWDLVEEAHHAGVLNADDVAGGNASDVVRALKKATDDDRRRVVAGLARRLEDAGWQPRAEQVTSDDLRCWIAAGNELGSHSWDHPCLDRCPPAEQRRQVEQAHQWLTEALGQAPDVFAWPNGNPAVPALAALRSLGYRLILGFDHRVCARRPDPMALSRLRVDTGADVARFEAIVSGAHSSVFGVVMRFRRVRESRRRA